MYKHKIISSIAVCTIFIGILCTVSYKGTSHRIYAEGSTSFAIDSPEKAYPIWNGKKLHGRILILFDSYPHSRGLRFYEDTPRLTPSNLMEYCIFKNIIRKIYYVVPEKEWLNFKQRKDMSPIRDITALDQGAYLNSFSGVALIAVTPSSLPIITEPVLTYNNNSLFEPSLVLDILKKKNIVSDVFISLQSNNHE